MKSDLSLPGHQEVFVVGDLAVVPECLGWRRRRCRWAVMPPEGSGQTWLVSLGRDSVTATRDPWPRSGGREALPISPDRLLRVSGVVRLAGDPHLLSDRIQEPDLGVGVLGLELSDLSPGGADHHRGAADPGWERAVGVGRRHEEAEPALP